MTCVIKIPATVAGGTVNREPLNVSASNKKAQNPGNIPFHFHLTHCARPVQVANWKNRISKGFTLFELLLAVTLLSVLSTISATGFFKLSNYWNDILLTQRLNHTATLAFSAMASDFENLLSSEVTGRGLRGQSADYEDNQRFWRLQFEDDRIALPVETFNKANNSWERHLIRYAIERKNGEFKLVRYARPWLSGPDSEVATDMFSDVTSMRIAYFDDNKWYDHWEKESMPEIVQISIAIMEDLRDDKHLSRVATFQVQVN